MVPERDRERTVAHGVSYFREMAGGVAGSADIARNDDNFRLFAPNGFAKVLHRATPASRIGRVDVQMQVSREEDFHLVWLSKDTATFSECSPLRHIVPPLGSGGRGHVKREAEILENRLCSPPDVEFRNVGTVTHLVHRRKTGGDKSEQLHGIQSEMRV